jgi:hypothetical protein
MFRLLELSEDRAANASASLRKIAASDCVASGAGEVEAFAGGF